MKSRKFKSYTEMLEIPDFIGRLEYLRFTDATVGRETFGWDRYLNQALYTSREWRDLRNKVILRDKGCDLGVEGYEIPTKAFIHHINPITVEDIKNRSPMVFDMNNLITVSRETHNAIHYGVEVKNFKQFAERSKGDTTLWTTKNTY